MVVTLGTAVTSSGAVNFTFQNLVNPAVCQIADNYTLTTKTSLGGTVIDTGTITGPTIKGVKILSPNGAETWEEGSQHHRITWEYFGLPGANTVKVEYSIDAGNTVWAVCKDENNIDMTAVTLSSGAVGKAWKIPVNLTDGTNVLTNCKIRITYNPTPAIIDLSNAVFNIKPYRVNLTAPAAGTEFIINKLYPAALT